MLAQNCSKGINLKLIYNLELHIRTFAIFSFKNLLEPKRMQIFPLKLQYQNVLSHLIKNNSVEAYEFHLILNSNLPYTL